MAKNNGTKKPPAPKPAPPVKAAPVPREPPPFPHGKAEWGKRR